MCKQTGTKGDTICDIELGNNPDNNQPVKGHEKDISGNKYKSRFYCIDCSKFIADEVVGYDSNEYPVVHHNNGHKHSVIFGADIKRLLELGISQVGQSTRYETAEMYGISVEKLEQVLANIGKGVLFVVGR
jgi:hypothetical protein